VSPPVTLRYRKADASLRYRLRSPASCVGFVAFVTSFASLSVASSTTKARITDVTSLCKFRGFSHPLLSSTLLPLRASVQKIRVIRAGTPAGIPASAANCCLISENPCFICGCSFSSSLFRATNAPFLRKLRKILTWLFVAFVPFCSNNPRHPPRYSGWNNRIRGQFLLSLCASVPLCETFFSSLH